MPRIGRSSARTKLLIAMLPINMASATFGAFRSCHIFIISSGDEVETLCNFGKISGISAPALNPSTIRIQSDASKAPRQRGRVDFRGRRRLRASILLSRNAAAPSRFEMQADCCQKRKFTHKRATIITCTAKIRSARRRERIVGFSLARLRIIATGMAVQRK